MERQQDETGDTRTRRLLGLPRSAKATGAINRPMTGPISADFEKHRQRQLERVAHYLPIELERVTTPLEELWKIRDCRLRALLEHARRYSRWHAKRLASIEVSSLSGSDLSMIPAMTKADLMDNWDEIVCDPTRENDGGI